VKMNVNLFKNKTFVVYVAIGLICFLTACSEDSGSVTGGGASDLKDDSVAESVNDVTESSSSVEIQSSSSVLTESISSSSIEHTDSQPVFSSESQYVSLSSSNEIAPESSSLADSSGIDPLEGISVTEGADNCEDCSHNPTTSSSYTSYKFKTGREEFYTASQTYIYIYPEENGVQGTGGDKAGFYQSTRRLETSTMQNEQYIVWLWSNTYFDGSKCNQDLEMFNKLCSSVSGEYKAYRGDCVSQKLELSCVYPNSLTTENDKEALLSLAEQEKNFFSEYWNDQHVLDETCYSEMIGREVTTRCVKDDSSK